MNDNPIEEEYTNIEELMKERPSQPEVRKVEDDYKDKYLRTLAEMENMRKRLMDEKQQAINFAIEDMLSDFLGPLDQFETALKFASKSSDEVKNWSQGFEMILGQLQSTLAEHDVKPFHSIGKIFDPHRHEAIENIETTEHADGIVVEEIVKGYEKNGRIVRPARVKVAVKPTNKGVNND